MLVGSGWAELALDEAAVRALHGQQLLVGAALHDGAALKDNNLLRVADGRQPVRNDHHCAG